MKTFEYVNAIVRAELRGAERQEEWQALGSPNSFAIWWKATYPEEWTLAHLGSGNDYERLGW